MRTVPLFVVISLFLSSPAFAQQPFEVAAWTFRASVAADTWTTLDALKRPGTYEANPLLSWAPRHRTTFAVTQVALAAVGEVAARALRRQGHIKTAWALLVAGTLIHSYAAHSNRKQGR